MHETTIAAASLLLASACLRTTPPHASAPEPTAPAAVDATRLAHGLELFEVHCAVCHGSEGTGRGPASEHLLPAPRDFTWDQFLLASTENGVPTDADLVRTLRRGMPGSPMPAWSWLAQPDLEDLALAVRELAIRGEERRLRDLGGWSGERPAAQALRAEAALRLEPGAPVAIPAPAPADAATLAHGHALFGEHCASCHGEDGRGVLRAGVVAPDLALGLLKGGARPEDLVRRVRVGMPGSSMPATELAPDELAALVLYTSTLLPADSDERGVQRPATVRARRVEGLVPESSADPRWEQASEVELVLVPLWWNAGAVRGARLAALHDGKRLALRLAWDDATPATDPFADAGRIDAAALQFSSAPSAPLYGMGAPDRPTFVWSWSSLAPDALADAAASVTRRVHEPAARLDVAPRGPRAVASQRVEVAEVRGIDSVRTATWNTGLDARPSAADGRWSVVFLHELAASAGDPLGLAPGETLHLACAVWNGAAGDRGARKSISTWNELVLDP